MRLFSFPALLLLAILASGCSLQTPPAAPELAGCIAERYSAPELAELGATLATPEKHLLGRTAAFPCNGSLSFATNTSYRETVSQEVHRAAATRAEYRAGRYATALPKGASALSRSRAGELGLLLEDVIATRRDVLVCEQVDVNSLALIAQLDPTFTLAATGRYVGVDAFDEAKSVAALLLELAGDFASAKALAACDQQLQGHFRSQVQHWNQFYAGTHPWMPGCSVHPEPDSFVLRCK